MCCLVTLTSLLVSTLLWLLLVLSILSISEGAEISYLPAPLPSGEGVESNVACPPPSSSPPSIPVKQASYSFMTQSPPVLVPFVPYSPHSLSNYNYLPSAITVASSRPLCNESSWRSPSQLPRDNDDNSNNHRGHDEEDESHVIYAKSKREEEGGRETSSNGINNSANREYHLLFSL